MYLIVGLGNPGPQYATTRHNIGFLAVDMLVQSLSNLRWNLKWQEAHKGLLASCKVDDIPWYFLKPQTYMNLSGESVQSVLHYYKIPLENMLVLQDDIDQVFGQMRFHKNRGHGGHNGIKDISAKLGTQDYARLKLGVGRPAHPDHAVADYVLQNFSKEENQKLPDFLNKAGDAVEAFIDLGLTKASNQFNQ